MVLGEPAFQEQCLQHLAPLSSPILFTAAFPPALDGRPVYLYRSLLKGWQVAKQPLQAIPPSGGSHLVGMSVVSV